MKHKPKRILKNQSPPVKNSEVQEAPACIYDKTPLYASTIVALVTFLVYLPALQNGFILNWDDDAYILTNTYIRSLNFDFFRWAFTDTYVASYWHPLTWISHAVDYAFWGLSPLGHHLTSIVLHAVNTGIVVSLTLKILGIIPRKSAQAAVIMNRRTILISAVITGLLFGLHPLKVESVVWISQRKDLLYSFFYLLSTSTYLHYVNRLDATMEQRHFIRNNLYNKSLAFFLLSLACKPMAVTLPAVLILLDWYPLRRITSWKNLAAMVVEKLPFVLVSGIISIASLITQKTGGGLKSLEETVLLSRVLVAFKGIILYVWNICVPIDLLTFYPYPKYVSLAKPEYLAAVLLVLGISALCLIMAKRQPALLAAWLYFIVTLLPVLGFFQAGAQAMADRYIYLPSLGLFILLGYAVAHGWVKAGSIKTTKMRITTHAITALSISFIIALSYLTIRQIGIWQDNSTFWNSLIRAYSVSIMANPDDDSAYYNRGCIYYRDNNFDRAIQDFNKTISLNPNYTEAYAHRGNSYLKTGDIDRAIAEYNTAIEKKPRYYTAYINRGMAYEDKGELDKAIADFTTGISLNPAEAHTRRDVYIGRGDLYVKTGRIALAVSDYQHACDLGSEAGCRKKLFPFAISPVIQKP